MVPTQKIGICTESERKGVRMIYAAACRTGKKYLPSIVRIGLNAHHSIQAVELDNLVDQRLARLASSKVQIFISYQIIHLVE
jgi:hypothetical protein